MAGTAFIRKGSQDEEAAVAKVHSNKRRKTEHGSSAAVSSELKPSTGRTSNQPKKSLLGNLDPFKRFRGSSKKPQTSTESLVDFYYFKAPQERNSVEELGIWERPTAEPEELRELLEEKAVGMTDEDKIEEREDRLEASQRRDEIRFGQRRKDYGEEAAKAYVTPGWTAYVPTIGQEKFLKEAAAAGR